MAQPLLSTLPDRISVPGADHKSGPHSFWAPSPSDGDAQTSPPVRAAMGRTRLAIAVPQHRLELAGFPPERLDAGMLNHAACAGDTIWAARAPGASPEGNQRRSSGPGGTGRHRDRLLDHAAGPERGCCLASGLGYFFFRFSLLLFFRRSAECARLYV
jgi:hypothetical protein